MKQAIKKALGPLLPAIDRLRLPPAARAEARRDRRGPAATAPDLERAVEEAIAWLGRAQDRSRSADGGVARDFSLIKGWATSYPETTGYIVPTMLTHGLWRNHEPTIARARRMLDWLVAIQLPEGAFQGGRIDAEPVVPVTFNTGQILLGLAAGAAHWPDRYTDPMRRAADWLVETMDDDGCWRRFPTPFAKPGEKVYETHVAWGLLEAARVAPDAGYGEAGLANVRWALKAQQPNGWLERCCLTDPAYPLTHTLGYALRGIVEAYRFSEDGFFLEAARRTADGLMTALGPDGFLPGQLRADWRSDERWACLTGTVQIAHSWLLLFSATGDARYRDAGFLANEYVRRTMALDGPDDQRGGIKGSFPVDGGYGPFEYLNWAPKFFVDSHMCEGHIRGLWTLDAAD